MGVNHLEPRSFSVHTKSLLYSWEKGTPHAPLCSAPRSPTSVWSLNNGGSNVGTRRVAGMAR